MFHADPSLNFGREIDTETRSMNASIVGEIVAEVINFDDKR